jgi:hypothetical protein
MKKKDTYPYVRRVTNGIWLKTSPRVEGRDVTFGGPNEGSFGNQLLAPLVYKGTLCLGISVVDTESDPVRSEFICRIRIRNRIRNK